jgi:hypothetical protein
MNLQDYQQAAQEAYDRDMKEREIAAQGELISWWRAQGPAERAYLERIASTGTPDEARKSVMDRVAMTGLSVDATRIGLNTFNKYGGNLAATFAVLEEQGSLRAQEAYYAQAQEDAAAGRIDPERELLAAEALREAGIKELVKGKNAHETLTQFVEQGHPAIKQMRGYDEVLDIVETNRAHEHFENNRMPWDKPKIEERLSETAQRREQVQSRSRAAVEAKWDAEAAKPPGVRERALARAELAAEKAVADPRLSAIGKARVSSRAKMEAVYDTHEEEDNANTPPPRAPTVAEEPEAEEQVA